MCTAARKSLRRDRPAPIIEGSRSLRSVLAAAPVIFAYRCHILLFIKVRFLIHPYLACIADRGQFRVCDRHEVQRLFDLKTNLPLDSTTYMDCLDADGIWRIGRLVSVHDSKATMVLNGTNSLYYRTLDIGSRELALVSVQCCV